MTAPSLPGCRLHRIEVFNWGTFHDKVWTFDVRGDNALLTGDIGSGKSTLVDAITTLVLRADRIAFNKAAGADGRERSLRSYVLGHYKSERNETTGQSRPVALRDARHYSVVLAVFANAGYADTATLAQVLRMRSPQDAQPEKFFVVADRELSIAKDFADFGEDLAPLRRRLRQSGARVHDTFADYGKDFRRRLGIGSEQAMELFHQTVSMKAVDNLNDFVRSHMLEPLDVSGRIGDLVAHFDDLTAAHDAVLRARAQLSLLEPLMVALDEYAALDERIDDLAALHNSARPYFAAHRHTVIETELGELDVRIGELDDELRELGADVEQLRVADRALDVEIAGAGGDRLASIAQELPALEAERNGRRQRLEEFNAVAAEVGLDAVGVSAQFTAARTRAGELAEAIVSTRVESERGLREQDRHRVDTEVEAEALNAELRSLASRQTNLPRESLALRDALCADLALDPEDLPFAGELVQVRADAAPWEGAAERVLHGFALSLLVPDRAYAGVARWINDRHLGTRIVYFRVPEQPNARGRAADRHGREVLLVDLLEVKPDTPHALWLLDELGRRANHVCADTVDSFRSAPKAVTREGQVKSRDRHEKDDRKQIGDRRQYVLGWSNAGKVAALVEHGKTLTATLQRLRDQIATGEGQIADLARRGEALAKLSVYQWRDLDWETSVRRIADLNAEAGRIRGASDVLQSLASEKDRVTAALTNLDERRTAAEGERGGARQRMDDLRAAGADAAALAGALPDDERLLASLDEIAARVELVRDSVRLVDAAELRALDMLRVDVEEARSGQVVVGRRAIRQMAAFRAAYPQEVVELDDAIESAQEFRALHERITSDDLPRFEDEFRRYLREHTIQDLLGLMATLEKNEDEIRQRVELINGSLLDIDYNDDRYIRLVPDPTPNTEVRDFRSELRACTEGVIGADAEQYSEARFLRVKAIIDRFKGREGSTDSDRAWTRRVTDVRQWFVFSASERWRTDDTEHESYTDSAGKSGGQKEKLAYTILAASLAYQFKLDFGAAKSRSFRFVVIDEAFGRGSDESTRYALRLFTQLGLQLLIVTPMQKIHVIEPHVATVGFVDNVEGSYSRLQCLTIEERARRAAVPSA